jgi:hypothetical protein
MKRDSALRAFSEDPHGDAPLDEEAARKVLAKRCGVSRQWVYGLGEELKRHEADRVLAALTRWNGEVMAANGEPLPPLHADLLALNHPSDVAAPSTMEP